MSETVLITGATVLSAASSTVEAYLIAVPPEVDFRVECNQTHSVRFYVANATFSAITGGAILTAYTATAIATTAGTNGNVYRIDAGSYDYVACVVTNDSLSSATVEVAVGYDLVAEAATALFTVAEARAFDKLQLATVADFPSASIIAKEAEIREFLELACGVNFIVTAHTDELHSGDGTSGLMLLWPLPITISAASLREDTTWTALTADQLAQLQVFDTGLVVWDGYYWWPEPRNIKVTYTAGHATVPALIKRAALLMCVNELPAQNTPWTADGYEAGGTSYSFSRGDGYKDQWSAIPDVMRAIRLYSRKLPGVS